ncbi:hypothetical protein IE81DRAFT_323320 [Ceraceosorus guamensis]|uniref:Bacteriophage T5 Orf172 DNA-binding domain-containing protein n=1 Tax=Ceraceosorus guamensis TaxID=1522189 RepID=A0A316W1Y1_9BASI|nr:hypothetical protein IE81DRAFT_323320 [Ceraceosorus guamensis]PWN42561.1 hypothetical protein IE81DRAFT_323320 [Ceraceosorus guamensis]
MPSFISDLARALRKTRIDGERDRPGARPVEESEIRPPKVPPKAASHGGSEWPAPMPGVQSRPRPVHAGVGCSADQETHPLPRPPLLLDQRISEHSIPSTSSSMHIRFPQPTPYSTATHQSQLPDFSPAAGVSLNGHAAYNSPILGTAHGRLAFPNPWDGVDASNSQPDRNINAPHPPVLHPAGPHPIPQSDFLQPGLAGPSSGKTSLSNPDRNEKAACPSSANKDAAPVLKGFPGQCAGIRKDGQRCTRRVGQARTSLVGTAKPPSKQPSGRTSASRSRTQSASPVKRTGDEPDAKTGRQDAPIVISDSETEMDTLPSCELQRTKQDVERDTYRAEFCHQHVKEINKATGIHLFVPDPFCTSASRTTFIPFSLYIPEVHPSSISASASSANFKSHASTSAKIRAIMGGPMSASDMKERGYVYIYSLRDRDTRDKYCFKVGRAARVFERIGQWREQCGSKDPVLRAFFPSNASQGVISGASAPTQQGIHGSHMWEHLVHLSLLQLDGCTKLSESCKDCGTKHREIFMVPKKCLVDSCDALRGGANRAGAVLDGFEKVCTLVERWRGFVEKVRMAQAGDDA